MTKAKISYQVTGINKDTGKRENLVILTNLDHLGDYKYQQQSHHQFRYNTITEISDKLRDSILNRCGETDNGRIAVPTDLLNRYIKELGKENEDRVLVKSEIIDIVYKGE